MTQRGSLSWRSGRFEQNRITRQTFAIDCSAFGPPGIPQHNTTTIEKTSTLAVQRDLRELRSDLETGHGERRIWQEVDSNF